MHALMYKIYYLTHLSVNSDTYSLYSIHLIRPHTPITQIYLESFNSILVPVHCFVKQYFLRLIVYLRIHHYSVNVVSKVFFAVHRKLLVSIIPRHLYDYMIYFTPAVTTGHKFSTFVITIVPHPAHEH